MAPKDHKHQVTKVLPRWISVGKQGSQRSNSSAHEYRKIAGQTTRIEPSSMKQHAIAMAWKQVKDTNELNFHASYTQ